LLAHGTPDVLGEMEEYLKLVTGGRGVPPQVVHELQQRYAAIGLRDTMTVADLREWLKSTSTNGWEWSETNGWVSASQLRRAPPLGHPLAYLLASNFLVPMRLPVEV
jgi:hypothetical protein